MSLTPPATPTRFDASRWRDTWALIGTDLERISQHMGHAESLVHRLYYALLPGFQALFWHRISRCLCCAAGAGCLG
jgi:hypothetical protein